MNAPESRTSRSVSLILWNDVSKPPPMLNAPGLYRSCASNPAPGSTSESPPPNGMLPSPEICSEMREPVCAEAGKASRAIEASASRVVANRNMDCLLERLDVRSEDRRQHRPRRNRPPPCFPRDRLPTRPRFHIYGNAWREAQRTAVRL